MVICDQESNDQQQIINKLPASTPHVVCLAFPMQGHIKPMMQLAELLASKGAMVTFVTTDFHLDRMKQAMNNTDETSSRSSSDNSTISNNSNDNVRLAGIALPPQFYTDSTFGDQLRLACDQNLELPFSRLIQDATEAVSLIIFDILLSWAYDVGSKLGIPTAGLWTSGPSSFVASWHIPLLLSQGILPIKDSNDKAALETTLTCIPGLPPIFAVKDLPSTLLVEDLSSDPMFQIISGRVGALRDATCPVLMNSVPELDRELEGFQGLPRVIHIGPIHTLDGRGLRSAGSLWSEGEASTWQAWLGAMAAGSVLFVSFGSLAKLPPSQAKAFAMGLLESGRPFLWACRPDLLDPTTMAEIQCHVSSGSSNQRGLLVPWVPQAQVLAHPAVGGFLTHCGWNSVLEAMWAGVPMLGFPQLAEQRMNCRMVEHVWGVGKELQLVHASDVDRGSTAAKHVASILGGHVADELRERCTYWQRTLRKAATEGGSSSLQNLDNLLRQSIVGLKTC